MRVTLGAPPDFELDHPVADGPLRQVEAMLFSLDLRGDTVRNAIDFAAAVPGVGPEDNFRVKDLRSLPGFDASTERRLARMLDGNGCDSSAIRRQLVAGAAPEAVAMVLEYGEIEPVGDRRGYDVATVSLLGPDYAVPVGLKRADFPSAAGAPIAQLEQRIASELITELGEDLGELDLEPPLLTSFDQRFAENHELRRHLRELGIEFVLPIGEEFDEAAGPRRASEPCRVRRLLAERMPFGFDGSPPDPEIYSMAVDPAHREYLFGLPGSSGEYSIVYPGVVAAPGRLSGRRGFARATDLVDLARSLHQPRILDRMHLLRFLHASPSGWDNAAHLLGALWAAHFGRLPTFDQ